MPNHSPAAALDETQLAALRETLTSKRDELTARVARLHEEPAPADPGDRGDSAQIAVAASERAGLDEREQSLLNEVERAIGKLDAGTYGLSEISGAPIAYDRLHALPWARTALGEEG